MSNPNNPRLSEHPIIILVGFVASLIAIIVFVTGRNSIPELISNEMSPTPIIRSSEDQQQNSNPIPVPTDVPSVSSGLKGTVTSSSLTVKVASMPMLALLNAPQNPLFVRNGVDLEIIGFKDIELINNQGTLRWYHINAPTEGLTDVWILASEVTLYR